jgi:hypothetical protein
VNGLFPPQTRVAPSDLPLRHHGCGAEGDAEAEAFTAADPIINAALGFRYEVAPMPQIILRESKD